MAQAGLQHLIFERSEGDDGVITLDAMAAVQVARNAAAPAPVQREIQAVLDWAWAHFPRSHGPVEDGGDWHHDLQEAEDGGWLTLTLTFSASAAFAEAFEAQWGAPDSD